MGPSTPIAPVTVAHIMKSVHASQEFQALITQGMTVHTNHVESTPQSLVLGAGVEVGVLSLFNGTTDVESGTN